MKYIVDIHGELEGDYEIIGKFEERPQGKWIDYNAYYKTCPFCKRTVGIDFLIQSYENPPKIYNFCPNCGADMRGEEK